MRREKRALAVAVRGSPWYAVGVEPLTDLKEFALDAADDTV
jgi:hypothetical protein